MVSIFTGLGAGFERGSGTMLGSSGLLGSGSLGRNNEQISLNAMTGNLLISQRDEFLVGLGPDSAIARTYNSMADVGDDNNDNWRQSTDRRVHGLTGTVGSSGSTVKRTSGDGSDITYSWNGTAGTYVATDGAGSYDTLSYASGVWTWTDGDTRFSEKYELYGAGNWRITEVANIRDQKLTFTYTGADLTRVTTQDGSYEEYSWSGSNITQILTGFTDLATSTAQTLTRTRYGYDASNRLTSVTVDLSPNDNSIADGKTYITTYTYDGTSKRVASISQTDGSRVDIAYDGSGRVQTFLQAEAAGVSRLTTIAYGAGSTTITDPLGAVTTLEYNSDGSLKQITAPPAYAGAAAQVTQFAYTAPGSGNVSSVTDALGVASTYTYDGSGNVLTATDRLGNVVTRTYGSRNELLTETRQGSDASGASESHTTRYAYNNFDLLAHIISPEGKVTVLQYGANSDEPIVVRVYRETFDLSAYTPFMPVAAGSVSAWSSSLADKTTNIIENYGRDARGNIVTSRKSSAALAAGTVDTSQPASITRYVYDQAGQLLSRTVTGLNTETFLYDGLGRITASTDLNGNTTSFVFNDSAQQTVVTLSNGYVQTSVYNQAGDLISFTDSGSNVTGGTATYAYDQRGQLRVTTDATGHKSYFIYDKTGRKIADVDHYGALVEYTYDENDRLVATVRYTEPVTGTPFSDLSDVTLTPEMSALRPAATATDLWTWNVYDAEGRTIETIDGDGGITRYQYDGESRLIGTVRYYNKLSTTELAWLKTAPAGHAANRLNNSQFSGAVGWMTGYDPSAIVDGGSPFTGLWNDTGLIRSNFTATAAGQVASISTDDTWFGVTAGERLAVQTGVEALGAVGDLTLTVWWRDANGTLIGNTDIGSLSGNQSYNTKLSGFVTVPPGAVSARLELYMTSSGAGAGSFNLVEPMVSVATAAQTIMPTFSPTVAIDPARDSIARNFYNKSGMLIGVLDGEGYLSQITYDIAGHKTAETAFATITEASLRASGSFNDLVAPLIAAANPADRVMRYVYDGQGYLRFQIDGLNQVTEYVYDSGVDGGAIGVVRQTIQYAGTIGTLSDYKIATVKTAVAALESDPDNRKTWAVYDLSNRLAYAIDATGAVTGYSYDNLGQVTKTIRFAATRSTLTLPTLSDMTAWEATETSAAANRITRNYYTARGELRYTLDAEGYVSWIDYDAEGRAVTTRRWDTAIAVDDGTTIVDIVGLASGSFVTNTTSYDNDGRVEYATDGEGIVTAYRYNANGTINSVHYAYGTDDVSQTMFTYDTAGRVRIQSDAYGTADQADTHFTYDGLGNVLSITDPNTNVTIQAYDRIGQMISRTDALAGTIAYQYNAFGDVVRTTDRNHNASYSYYDKLGRLTLSYDAEQYGTQNSYTVFGELASITRWYKRAANAGSVTETVQPTFELDAKDATTNFEYDRLGRLTKTIDAELDPVAGGASRSYEEYAYNAFGNRTSVRNRIGGTTIYAYNRRGLLESETLPTQAFTTDGIAQAGTIINRFEYDARGNRTKMIEASNMAEHRTTTYQYDKLDRLIETRGDAVPDGVSGISAVPVTKIAYDRRGNIIETTDATGARTLSYYDKLDRLVVSIDALGYYSTVTYSVDSGIRREVSRTYATPVTLPGVPGGTSPLPPAGAFRESASTFDKLGRLQTISVADILTGQWSGTPTSGTYGTSVTTLTTSYEYDATGNLIKTTDAGGGIVYAYYDKLNRKFAQVDAERYQTMWALDANGNVLTEMRAANTVTSPSISGFAAGAISDSDRITTFSYDRMGRRLTETRAKVVAYSIDPVSGELTVLDDGSGTINATVTYTYNGLGQVLSKSEATGDTVTYTYDSGGRLIQETRPGYADNNAAAVSPTLRYSYDGLNNLVRTQQGGFIADDVNDRITRYGYGEGGRLVSMTDAATVSGVTRSYFYDLAGRKIGESYDRANSLGTTTKEGIGYQYDALGQLTAQTFNAVAGTTWTQVGDDVRMAYNAYGELSARGINGLQEQFDYDAAGRLSRSNAGDGVWRFYLYDASGNQTLAIESEGTDLSGNTTDQVLSIATAGGTIAIGSAYIDGINATISLADKRGQVTASIQTRRQLNSVATPADLIASRSYNAFGETLTETDARGFTTTYTYNTIGRVTSVQHAAVNYEITPGVFTVITPTDGYAYDLSGRLIGTRDANSMADTAGKWTSRLLLAGTGYGDANALVVKEYHTDGGIRTNAYDVFGDLRDAADEIDRHTYNSYNKIGQLIQVTHPGGLVDNYGYDVLGQRTTHWNSFLTASDVERTDYDVQGRIISSVAFGGDAVTTTYSWSAATGTTGLGTFGAHTQRTTYINGRWTEDVSDGFGHAISHTDMGGRVTNFAYDSAGRLTERSGAEVQRYTYLNTGLAGAVSTGTISGSVFIESAHADYGYDENGNKLTEYATVGGVVTQNASAAYDALGRMTSWAEAGNSVAPSANVAWSYDASGNIRHLTQSYQWIDSYGTASATPTGPEDFWYRYDSMNRVVTDRGIMTGSEVTRGSTGVDITYDAAGRRHTVLSDDYLTGYASVWVWYSDPEDHHEVEPMNPGVNGDYEARERSFFGQRLETYEYDSAGNLGTVGIAESGYSDEGNGNLVSTGAIDRAVGGSTFSYDALGRLLHQVDTNSLGIISYDNRQYFDTKGRVYLQETTSIQSNAFVYVAGTYTTTINNSYGDGTVDYALGAVITSTTSGYATENGTYRTLPVSVTSNAYAWYDAPVQSTVVHQPDTSQTNAFTTTYNYTGSGVLTSAVVADGQPRTITVTSDALGQVIRRDETKNSGNTKPGGDPHEVWYRFNGRQIGHNGNNSTYDSSYAGSLEDRERTPFSGTSAGSFRFGATAGASYADFNTRLTPINTFQQGSSGGSYTVRTGDSLSSIAAQLWGDASLWYKLAEANGLNAGSALIEGQTLNVPGGVIRSSNSASTFKPYDPSDAYGDTSPTTPKPQAANKNKCGVFGQILLVVIAVAVTIASQGTLTGLVGSPILGGALAGAAGSVVSQSFGVATGIQEKFSFKGVALAALSGAVGGALQNVTPFGTATGGLAKFGNAAVRGALGSAISQGIGVATGLQSKFDFAGVAAAGIGAGVGSVVGGKLDIRSLAENASAGNIAGHLLTNTASGIANAATRSLINGTDFGDNLMAALPDTIGNTIGSLVAGIGSMRGSKGPINLLPDNFFDPVRQPGSSRMLPGTATSEGVEQSGGIEVDSSGNGMPATIHGQNSPSSSVVHIDGSTENSVTPDVVVEARRDTRNAILQLDSVGKYDQVLQEAIGLGIEDEEEKYLFRIRSLEDRTQRGFLRGASIASDFIPITGTYKGVGELVTGKDMITNEPVNRVAVGAGVAISIIPGGRRVVQLAIGRAAAKGGAVEFAAGRQAFTADLSYVTGKAALARNRAIGAVISEDLSGLRLTHTPEYSPFIGHGVAMEGTGTQIGKQVFSSRAELRNTIVHEELHHRWWSRGVYDHHPAGSAMETKFYNTIERYERMRGW